MDERNVTIGDIFRAARFTPGVDTPPARLPPPPEGLGAGRAAEMLTPVNLPEFFSALLGPRQDQPPDFGLGLVDMRFLRRSTLEALLIDLEEAARRWRGREPHANLGPSVEAIKRHLATRHEASWTF